MNKTKKNPPKLNNDIKSPCIGACRLIDNTCSGCGRTSKEIQNWNNLSNHQKLLIINRLKNELPKH